MVNSCRPSCFLLDAPDPAGQNPRMGDAGTEEPGNDVLIRAAAAYDGVVGDPSRFGPVAVAVLREARATGDTDAVIVALRAVAWFERSRLRNGDALRLLNDAAALARRTRRPHRLGEVLVTRAAVNLELGRVPAAVRDLDRAGALVDPAAAPDLELKRAALLHNVGRIGAAADGYRRVLADPYAGVDVRTRAANNLGLTEALRGRSREAVKQIDLATELAPAVGPAFVAVVAHNRGQVLALCGRLTESLAQFDDALVLLAAAELPLGEFFAEHAETLAALRVLPEAQELARRAVEELESHDVPLMAAEARLRQAEIALLFGDVAAARGLAAAAAAQFRSQRRPGFVALATVVEARAEVRAGTLTSAHLETVRRAADVLARLGLVSAAVEAGLATGRAARMLGRPALARRRLRAAHALSKGGAVLVRLRGTLAAALAAELDGDTAAVLARCREGLADLAQHRSALASTELRALASGHGIELGLLGLGVLLRTGSPARILNWVERTRAVALLTVEPPAPDDVREERAELAAVHAELVTARRESGTEPAALAARQRAIEHRIRRATWHRRGSGVQRGAVATSQELVELLGDQALVSYGRHDGEMFAVVVHGVRSGLHRLGPWAPVRFEADALLFGLRRLTRSGTAGALVSSRASAEHSLRTLRDLLVTPLGLDPRVPLVVVPARDTHRIPWPALHDAPVTVAPSASAWARTARTPVPVDGRVVVVGGPGLPGAELEVAEVARRHPGAVALAPPKSTAEAVLDAMAGADLVHLACHGLLRADNPTFSALEVTDGRLTVQELDMRGIAPRRIVLAACDSAADVSYAGDELVGFVSALLARGTAGVVASVVAVGDVEAVELMRGLHDNLTAGATMAGALHAARAVTDRADPRQFVNWCAFTAYGAG
jgi:tetratricopeptide (TPR) repeat protein